MHPCRGTQSRWSQYLRLGTAGSHRPGWGLGCQVLAPRTPRLLSCPVPADMSSGEVALYVLALLSSCEDPQHVQALGCTVNLLRILQQKTDEEMASLGTPGGEGGPGVPGEASPSSAPHQLAPLGFAEAKGVPKTTLYSVSLDALGLCLTGTSGYQVASVALAKQVLSRTNNLSVGKGPLQPRRVPSAGKAPFPTALPWRAWQ